MIAFASLGGKEHSRAFQVTAGATVIKGLTKPFYKVPPWPMASAKTYIENVLKETSSNFKKYVECWLRKRKTRGRNKQAAGQEILCFAFRVWEDTRLKEYVHGCM